MVLFPIGETMIQARRDFHNIFITEISRPRHPHFLGGRMATQKTSRDVFKRYLVITFCCSQDKYKFHFRSKLQNEDNIFG